MFSLGIRLSIITVFMMLFYVAHNESNKTGVDNIIQEQAASVIFSKATQSTPEETNKNHTYVSFDNILNKVLLATSSTTDSIFSSEDNHQVVTSSSTTNLGDAIVNIYCTQETSEYKRIISGTGFLISEKGVILTNAHVAQFLLLEETKEQGMVECSARVGKAAKNAYKVSLLYISPTWLTKHAELITSTNPRGTGENDFALLYITDTANGSKLPETFTYLPPSTNTLTTKMRNRVVILVGYPINETNNFTDGNRLIATTTITDIYTFGDGQADIFTLGETILGYQGASGGPVIDNLGRAFGVITTKEENSTQLNAITIAHIDRTIRKETGFDLISTMQGDLAYRSRLFNEHISPILKTILEKYLED